MNIKICRKADLIIGCKLEGHGSHWFDQVGEEVGNTGTLLKHHVAILPVCEVRLTQVCTTNTHYQMEWIHISITTEHKKLPVVLQICNKLCTHFAYSYLMALLSYGKCSNNLSECCLIMLTQHIWQVRNNSCTPHQ